jgi:hypothetical protein
MNAANDIDLNPHDRWFEHRQTDAGPKARQVPIIIRIDANSVGGAFMSLKPVFSTAC